MHFCFAGWINLLEQICPSAELSVTTQVDKVLGKLEIEIQKFLLCTASGLWALCDHIQVSHTQSITTSHLKIICHMVIPSELY